MDSKKIVLDYLTTTLVETRKGKFSFMGMTNDVKMQKEDLDLALKELENERQINQTIVDNNDIFFIELLP